MRVAVAPVHLVLVVALAAAAPAVRAQDAGPPPPPPAENPAVDEPAELPSEAPTAPAGGVGDVGQVARVLEGVEFKGRVYFREETLKSFMLHPLPGPLDEELLRADAGRMAQRYHDRGYLKATVAVEVTPGTPPKGARAVFTIHAGERAELQKVHVVGNVNVDEAALKEGFFSRPPEPLGVLTRAGFFHRPYLDQDAQRLVANYYKRGYLEARVLDTRVEANPTLDGLDVTLRVVEGPVYELGGLHFVGELPKDADLPAMRAQISIRDGDVCDLVSIQQQADSLLNPLREEGYPFARFEQSVQVVPPPSHDPEHRAVALTLKFVRGPKPVVRSVIIAGNKGTAEHVIRRDVAIKEGKPYDYAAVKETERNLMGTGFFQRVQARAIPTGDPQVVDMEVDVVEQQTWLASIAPAFDTTAGGEGLIGVGILADRNFLGTGIYVSTFARLSSRKQTFDLTASDPRFLDSHVVLTGELHRREISYLAFRTRSEVGGGLRTSVPVGGGFYVGGGLGAEYGGVVLYSKKAGDPFDGPRIVPSELFPTGVLRNPLSVSLAWDHRDNILLPRNGAYASLSSTYAGPFTLSGVDFLDSGAQLKLFWTPLFNITLKSNTDLGGVFSPHGGRVPVTDRYFLGGLGSVRGYPALSLGPVEAVPCTPRTSDASAVRDGCTPVSSQSSATGGGTIGVEVGGVVRAVQNLEVEFPLWPQTPFRGFLFLDAGNTFSESELSQVFAGKSIGAGRQSALNLYFSTGFGFLIETPVLPFRFEWSLPLQKNTQLSDLSFFLGIGSAF